MPARAPLLIDLDETPPEVTPATAPPIEDAAGARALRTVAVIAARPRSRAARFFWAALGAFLTFALSVGAWAFVADLLARNPVLGTIAAVLTGVLVLATLILGLREVAAYTRLGRLDALRRRAEAAHDAADLVAARRSVAEVAALYAGRPDLAWGRARLAERAADQFDADGVLAQAEAELMAPLDAAARREIEGAARRVATVTAFVPLALADVATALWANLAMIRRIAEIYGGRGGALGAWRLTRMVLAHLVGTGVVAVGDDLVHSVAGGGLLAKLSRRFGEGVVNASLTARVGVAAMDVCRPLPFRALPRPRVTALVQRALTGAFAAAAETAAAKFPRKEG